MLDIDRNISPKTSGKAVQDYGYDSFGNLHDSKNRIKQPYTFTGREYDRETGLYFYRARYYDAEAGRFTSEDPKLKHGNYMIESSVCNKNMTSQ